MRGQTREAELKEGKVEGDEITIVGMLNFGDNEVRITCTGTVAEGELKLTRAVGEIAQEDVVAKKGAPAVTMKAPAGQAERGGRGRGQIVPNDDDKPAFPPPPGSMGGGQSRNFGLGNPDTFAWIRGFSSAPNPKPPVELVPGAARAASQRKLLRLSCGNKDGLMRVSQGVHACLKEKHVPHRWHVDEHDRDFQHWKRALYQFARLIFLPAVKP